MGVVNFRVKNGLYVVEDSDSSGNLTLLDGEIKSDNDLTVFPSATSGTNTAGNDMIIQGGAGTGSGAGGAIKFNVAVAGGSGSSVNTLETKMQIASTGIVTMTDGTNASNTTSGTLQVTGGVGISANLYANVARFTGGTASSSTTTGALIVTGGTGISEDLYVGADAYVGDDLSLTSDAAIINFGLHSDVLLTHVADVGLQLSTTATSGANPVFEIYQDNADANGGVLRFKKEAGDAGTGESADNDKLGVIQFFGDDAADVQNNFGTIEGRIQDASNNDELGRLMLRPRADSGGAGGIIIDGLTVEGLLDKKHHITVAVGGNRSGDATGYVESSAGGVISLFQAPTDNSSKNAQHFAANGRGSVTEYTVLPAVNIGGGSTPRTFSATATASGSAGNYTTNLFVNGTGYTEARISSVVGQIEGNRNSGLGSALVLETVDDQNFNGIYFSRDQANALSWIDADISSNLATEGTWGAGWLTEGTDFSIGFHAAKYDSCAIAEAGQTQLNPLVSGKSLFRMTTAGHVGIKGAPSATATLQVYATGETNVGAVIALESGSAEPASTTHRLYNKGGNLFWNGSNLSAASASALGDLSDVTFSSSSTMTTLTIASLNAFVFANDDDASISVTATTGTTAGKPLTISAGSSATGSNNVNGGNLILASGGGDGNGTSSIQFKTKVANTDAAAERMRIHTDGNVGIGDAAPGTLLQLSGENAYLTLKNTSAENGEGGAETKIIFEDHANASLGQIEVSHSGTADDTKGKMILSTHNGTALTAALTISDAQLATFSGAVSIAGNLTVSGTTTQVDSTTLTTQDAMFSMGTGQTASDADALDFGFYGTYDVSGTQRYAGLLRDASDSGTFKFFTTTGNSHAEPTTTVNTTSGFTLAPVDMAALAATTGTSSGILKTDDATDATSTTDGSIQTDGGLSVVKDGIFGNDLYLLNDSAAFGLGAGKDVTITHDGGTGARLASAGAFIIDGEDDLTLDVGDGKDVLLLEAGTTYASIGQGSVDIANIGEASATTVDTFDCTAFQATKYLIVVEDTTNTNYMSTEILVLGDENGGSAVGYLTQYAVVFNDTELGDFTVTGSSNNINLQYTAGNMSGTSQHKVRVVATRIASI